MALLGNLTGSAQYFNDDDFYAGIATTSLRFNSADDAYLTREFDAPSNNKKWTYSTWLKRSKLGAHQAIISSNVDGSNYFDFRFSDADILYVQNRVGASNLIAHGTTSKFRDTSAWYNIVLIYDSDNSTAANRTLVYVNGVKHTLAAVAGDGDASYFNVDGINHNFGASRTADGSGTVWSEFGGYVSEVNFCDGQAYAPTNFGETKNGVWIPKNTSGLTFGNNGFRIRHDQVGVGTASTSTIGADVSGNTNHLTSVNVVASDCAMPDSPENNFCTLNPLAPVTANTPTYSEGNLKLTGTSYGNWRTALTTFKVTEGKWYFEFKIIGGTYHIIGVTSVESDGLATAATQYLGKTATGYGYQSADGKVTTNSSDIYAGSTYSSSHVVGVALDLDNNKLYFARDNTWQNSGDPTSGSTGTGAVSITDADGYIVAYSVYQAAAVGVLNFGQDASFAGGLTGGDIGTATDGNANGLFKYAPPSGYLALCTANLPEPTIGANSDTQADDYFNSVLYTGNESSRSIAVGFQSDWVWIKNRETTRYHRVYDSSRGATKALYTNSADDEETNATELTAFNSNGFTLGAGVGSNENNDTFISWNWKANGGTTTTNDASSTGIGTIDSVFQANTTAGFSIVTYTGNSTAGATVRHGLTVAPEMVIVKSRTSAHNWVVYHKGQGVDKYIELNLTTASQAQSSYNMFNSTAPTSSVFTIGSLVNTNTDKNYIAYCFHPVEGYSKFGSYTGNGSADGTFVFTGFRPAWIMFKRTDSANSWLILDNQRDTDNPVHKFLHADATDAEDTSNDQDVDFTSNGFKIRNANARNNASGGSYIYMAFAEQPFKYANAK